MGALEIIVIICAALIASSVLITAAIRKKQGKSSCGCGCNCAHCSGCGYVKKDKDK